MYRKMCKRRHLLLADFEPIYGLGNEQLRHRYMGRDNMENNKKMSAIESKRKAMEASRKAYLKAKKNGTLKPVVMAQ